MASSRNLINMMLKLVLLFVLFLNIKAIHHQHHRRKGWLLNDGNVMPPTAFGTFEKIEELENLRKAIEWAIEAGYRHIDTSHIYLTEGVVGDSVKRVIERGIVKREDLFITTKLDILFGREFVIPALRQSLKRLQMDYVDLYLIHFLDNLATGGTVPYLDVWKGMEDAKKSGLTKSIGISNFGSLQINDILANSDLRPAVNQIEVNPTFTNLELVAYCQSEGIRVMSYSPFGFMVPRPINEDPPPPSFDNPVLVKIARKYGKTTSQIIIRYLVDRDTIPILKSTNREHIISNIHIFDFSLTDKEVYVINEFNLNKKLINQSFITNNFFLYYFGIGKEEFLKQFFGNVSSINQ